MLEGLVPRLQDQLCLVTTQLTVSIGTRLNVIRSEGDGVKGSNSWSDSSQNPTPHNHNILIYDNQTVRTWEEGVSTLVKNIEYKGKFYYEVSKASN